MRTKTPTLTAISLPPNPVWRSYSGGQLLREFRGSGASPDDHFPEDWLASTVGARNSEHGQSEDEGLSRILSAEGSESRLPRKTSPKRRRPKLHADYLGHFLNGSVSHRREGRDGLTFADALRKNPEFWFGEREARSRNGMGVLWKLLDSSVRLQLQAHPDARFAREHLNSDAGKTECWYILATRGEASVYLGFQRAPSRAAWARMIREQRVAEMLACFDPIPVQAGGCFVVPAGTPHAIGAGVFMVELMEPTDWVVRCERANGEVVLPPEACFMGLNLERCLDVFDYRARSTTEIRRALQQTPRVVHANDTFIEEELISAAWHSFFRLHRLRGRISEEPLAHCTPETADWARSRLGARESSAAVDFVGDRKRQRTAALQDLAAGRTYHGPFRARWPGKELMLLIALKGAGELTASEETCQVRAGQTWLLPGAIAEWQWQANTPDWECLLAKLPLVTEASTTRRFSFATNSR